MCCCFLCVLFCPFCAKCDFFCSVSSSVFLCSLYALLLCALILFCLRFFCFFFCLFYVLDDIQGTNANFFFSPVFLSSFFVSFFCFKTYDVKFRDIATGKDLDDVIIKTSGDVCWGADATTVFYTTQAGIGLLLDVAFLMVVLVVSVVLLVLVFSSL